MFSGFLHRFNYSCKLEMVLLADVGSLLQSYMVMYVINYHINFVEKSISTYLPLILMHIKIIVFSSKIFYFKILLYLPISVSRFLLATAVPGFFIQVPDLFYL